METEAPNSDASAVGAACLEIQGLLHAIAIRWYDLNRDEIEPLVQEVFLTYWKRRDKVTDFRRWMLGAMIRACRKHLSRRGRTVPLPEAVELLEDPKLLGFANEILVKLAIEQALARTPERCRTLIEERFLNDRSLGEIAESRGTTEIYAKKMVYGCLKAFRERYIRMTTPRPS